MKVGDSVTDVYGYTGKIIKLCYNGCVDIEYNHNGKVDTCLLENLTLVQSQPQEAHQDTHYKKEVQPIDLIDAFNLDFNAGNVIKYVARAKHKGNELEDLRKAKYYLDRLYEKAAKA